MKSRDKLVTQRFYDDLSVIPTPDGDSEFSAHFAEHVLKCVEETHAMRVLDLGCGSGKYLRAFSSSVAAIVGTDISRGQLRRALQTCANAPSPCLAQADAERLPFRDKCMDLVFSYGVLGEYAPIIPAIREVARVLRPKGIFVMVFLNLLTPYRIWKTIKIAVIRLLMGSDTGGYLRAGGRMLARFPASLPYVRAVAGQAGFGQVRFHDLKDIRGHVLATCVRR